MPSIEFEKEFEVSFARSHHLAERVQPQHQPGEDPFRTKAYLALKETFGRDLFALRETNGVGGPASFYISYRIAIRAQRLNEFRQKVAELGLQIQETGNGSKR